MASFIHHKISVQCQVESYFYSCFSETKAENNKKIQKLVCDSKDNLTVDKAVNVPGHID